MIKNLIVFIIGVLLLLVLVGIYILRMSGDSVPTLEDVKTAISQAQYCEIKDDCVEVNSRCPFGCSLFVNKIEQTNIQNMINAYRGPDCVYGCAKVKGYDCVSKRCSILF